MTKILIPAISLLIITACEPIEPSNGGAETANDAATGFDPIADPSMEDMDTSAFSDLGG